jgi:hypothetical protein
VQQSASAIPQCHREIGVDCESTIPKLDGLYESPDSIELIGQVGQNLALAQCSDTIKPRVSKCAPEFYDLLLTIRLFPDPNTAFFCKLDAIGISIG